MTHELQPTETPFWTIDEQLGELELKERPSGPDLYTVRLKAHTATTPYHASRELYPLAHDGAKHEVSGRAYILVPDLTFTVGFFGSPRSSGPIGDVTSTAWEGMRHHDIARVRGLYYDEDQTLAIWEVDAFGRLDEFAHARLWQLFEGFMTKRFPRSHYIFTDDAEPFEGTARNREFLQSLGYQHVERTHRIWNKEVPRR